MNSAIIYRKINFKRLSEIIISFSPFKYLPGFMLFAIYGVFGIAIIINIYVLSRFTVDDAFISWRYGRNIVEFGVWGYNPTYFDLTQAYTNPLYALLSIIPPLIGMDMVLFFKLASFSVLLFFISLIVRSRKEIFFATLLVLTCLIYPGSVVHLFSGLETFAYALFFGLIFAAIEDRRMYIAIALSIAIFFLRPEGWIFVFITPVLVFMKSHKGRNESIITTLKNLWILIAVMPIIAMLYFIYHRTYFGFYLPNTFYAKSMISSFNIEIFYTYCIAIILGTAHFYFYRKISVYLLILALIAPSYIYIISDLQMNYFQRFSFQILFPVTAYITYSILRWDPVHKWKFSIFSSTIVTRRSISLGVLIAIYGIWSLVSVQSWQMAHFANYYPRFHNSYADLGVEMAKYGNRHGRLTFALSEAGITAFHSQAISLDYIGLGSSAVAQNGVSFKLLDTYNPSIVMIGRESESSLVTTYGRDVLYAWAKSRNYFIQCDLILDRSYRTAIFVREPIPFISEVCARAEHKNLGSDKAFFWNNMASPPWRWWHA